MSARKERPILFSASEVRAILAGDKTQTRRAVKLNPAGHASLGGRQWYLGDPNAVLACPFGQAGDRLWVKEAWRIGAWDETDGTFAIDYCDGPDRRFRPTPCTPEGQELFNRLWTQSCNELYSKGIKPGADGSYHWKPGESSLRWRSPVVMPRWASRILLEIVSVSVEGSPWVWVIEFKKVESV